MKAMKAIRHGDLCLVRITEMPDNIKSVKTKTIMQGSHGNNHDVKGGTIYLKDVNAFVFGYLVAGKKCVLLHPDHGTGKGSIKTVELNEGIYELRRQFEYKSEYMTQVID